MVFKEKMVCVLKVKGKIVRENKDQVSIPFGSEYSILLKNLHSRKALVSIYIDGTDVLNGKKIIVNANSEVELERFLDDLDKGNKFLFIQKTEKIQEHRGDKVDDGIIRVEYQFEQPPVNYNWYPYTTTYTWNTGSYTPTTTYNVNNTTTKSVLRSTNLNTSCCLDSFDAPQQDEGITVKGSESTQQFQYGSVGTLESEKHVITLRLQGFKDDGKPVEKVVTVKDKKICTTCGTKNEYNHKFCKECGTFLE